MHAIAIDVLIALQGFALLFVGLHNWIPLGSLNDVKAVHRVFPTGKLIVTTLTNFIPVAIGLAGSLLYFRKGFPGWLIWYLWIFYLLAVYGSLKAWWIPYLFRADAEHAARDRAMYASTHAFLPERNGVRPNTLHVIFDVVTIAILVDLALVTISSR